ncbi:phospholipase-like protein [Tanacetum coccineum]
MEGVSQCMNDDQVDKCTSVDHVDKRFNDEYDSIAVDGLISLKSQDVDHISKKSFVMDDPEFKAKDNEEGSYFDTFLSTQQVRELINDFFDTPPIRLDSVQTDVVPFQRQKYPGKACVSPYVQPSSTEVKCKKRRRVMKLDKPNILIKTLIGPDGNEILLLPWKEYEYPFYYIDGVKYGVPWFAKSVKKVYFPMNESDSHWVLGELDITSGVITFYDSLEGHPGGVETHHFWLEVRQILEFQFLLYLDSVEVFEKKKIDKASYLISF